MCVVCVPNHAHRSFAKRLGTVRIMSLCRLTGWNEVTNWLNCQLCRLQKKTTTKPFALDKHSECTKKKQDINSLLADDLWSRDEWPSAVCGFKWRERERDALAQESIPDVSSSLLINTVAVRFARALRRDNTHTRYRKTIVASSFANVAWQKAFIKQLRWAKWFSVAREWWLGAG